MLNSVKKIRALHNKKKTILTLVLSINTPLQVKWSVPKVTLID